MRCAFLWDCVQVRALCPSAALLRKLKVSLKNPSASSWWPQSEQRLGVVVALTPLDTLWFLSLWVPGRGTCLVLPSSPRLPGRMTDLGEQLGADLAGSGKVLSQQLEQTASCRPSTGPQCLTGDALLWCTFLKWSSSVAIGRVQQVSAL